ncbi:MAG: copper resistance CopC family protein [Pseudomonadota bacterium]
MRHFFLAVVLLFGASVAWAHSPVRATSPADGASLAAAPTEVVLTFAQNIRLTRMTARRADGAATPLDLSGHARFTTELVVPFTGDGPGTYVIEWRGLAEDGHTQQGSFSFVVD